MKSELLYLESPKIYSILSEVLSIGEDENGQYLDLNKTCHYPGGGGQPTDISWISQGENKSQIVLAKNIDGIARHYVHKNIGFFKEKNVAINISSDSRRLFSAYHTAGHWIAGIITENLILNWIPIKAHHYPNEAYVEFSGDFDGDSDDIISRIYLCMSIDRQSQPMVKWEVISIKEIEKISNCNLPVNFTPNPNKPFRLVTIDMYKSVPCGGVHVEKLSEIKSVKIESISLKNRKIRVRYSVEIWSELAS